MGESIDLGRVYIMTSVKILPYRPPARLIRAKCALKTPAHVFRLNIYQNCFFNPLKVHCTMNTPVVPPHHWSAFICFLDSKASPDSSCHSVLSCIVVQLSECNSIQPNTQETFLSGHPELEGDPSDLGVGREG